MGWLSYYPSLMYIVIDKGQDQRTEASQSGHVQTRGIASHPLEATQGMSVV